MKTRKKLLLGISLGTIAILTLMMIFFGYPLKSSDTEIAINTPAGDFDIAYEYESVDDLIKDSDYIVIGKATEAMQQSEIYQTYKYTFEVEQYIKGDKVSNQIAVYSRKDAINIGDEYLLFLDYWESVFYPEPNYTPLYEGAIIEINGDALISKSKFINDMSKEELIKIISQSPLLMLKQKKEYNIRDKAVNTDDLIRSSDNIIHIKTTHVEKINLDVSEAQYQLINQLKGENFNLPLLLLPVDIKEGEEYILFLDSTGRPITRSDSIVEKKDKVMWQELLVKLEK